jgi:hypothetical protein
VLERIHLGRPLHARSYERYVSPTLPPFQLDRVMDGYLGGAGDRVPFPDLEVGQLVQHFQGWRNGGDASRFTARDEGARGRAIRLSGCARPHRTDRVGPVCS